MRSKKTKRLGLVVIGGLLLLLDLAALHDILVDEPDPYAEWLCLAFSLPIWFWLVRSFRKQ